MGFSIFAAGLYYLWPAVYSCRVRWFLWKLRIYESNTQIEQLIEMYRAEECLWDSGHAHYLD
jgi:hypothetical protein